MTRFRWGILATGNIAGAMAAALRLVPGAELRAVASRKASSAKAFAAQWDIPTAYGSYDALLADPQIDIVYIATPNARHKDLILAALAAGKHVLCEKPLTTTPEDTARCAEAARTAGLFLMEAMWTAFFPAMQKARALIDDGAIGRVHHLSARFVSFRDLERFPSLFDPALGGGASLDLGIYPVAAALILAGPIEHAAASVVRGPTGVDEMVGISATHRSGCLSQLSYGFRTEMPVALRVTGSKGQIDIPQDFHHPVRLHLHRDNRDEVLHLPAMGKGYAHEALEVHRCLDAGATESSIWPPARSIEVARLLYQVAH